MKKLFLILVSLIFACGFSCHAQNGPTKPSVALTWTQSTTPGVTLNNVYRCTSTGTACAPAPPAIFTSTAPITSYTDSTVAVSTTYYYAVTASVGATESGYSNVVEAAVPASPNAPTLNTPTETGALKKDTGTLAARIVWK